MTAVPKRKLTAAEYLVIENAAAFKSEFYRGEMFAMAGASPAHNFIKENLSGELHARLKGGPCRALSGDQRVLVEATGLYTYPDLLIFCGPPEYAAVDPNTLVNPVVIIEVLSPGTEKYDRGTKFRNYQRIPSLREYVMVAQDEAVVERYVRQPTDDWLLTTVTGLDKEMALTSAPVQIPLADVYAGVAFPDPPPR